MTRQPGSDPDDTDEKMNFCTKGIAAAATELSDGKASAKGTGQTGKALTSFLYLSALSMAATHPAKVV
jgi:hypothetical protein